MRVFPSSMATSLGRDLTSETRGHADEHFDGDRSVYGPLTDGKAPAAAVAQRRPTPKMLMAGGDPAMSARRNAGETPAFQAISPRRPWSLRHASTTPKLPLPTP